MAEFGFSCWTYFSINRAWDTLAKDYSDLGLNMPLTPVFNEGDDPEKLLRLLDQFHALGMKAIVFDGRVTAQKNAARDEQGYKSYHCQTRRPSSQYENPYVQARAKGQGNCA